MTGARSGSCQRLRRCFGHLKARSTSRRGRASRSQRPVRLERLEPRLLLAVTLEADTHQIVEAAGTAELTAFLSEPRPVDVTIELGVSGTASAAADYELSTSHIVIPAGGRSGTARVTALQDALNEGDETIVVDLIDVVNDVEADNQTQTIILVDDDPPPTVTLSVNDGTISENGGVATLTAALSAVSGRAVVVDLDYFGTAVRGTDFSASSQLIIPAGSLIRSVPISSFQDEIDEFAETIFVRVEGVTNGLLVGVEQFETTIVDDDSPPEVTIRVDPSAILESQGQAQVVASLSQISGKDVTVDLTFSGTATVGSDYEAATSIVIPQGSLTGAATITAVSDSLVELPETVVVGVATVTNGNNPGQLPVVTTILDDDSLPMVALSADDSEIVEGEAWELTLSLSSPAGRDVKVELGYSGLAAAGIDFTPVRQVVIPAGSQSQVVLIQSTADATDELDELLNVEILSVTHGTELDSQQASVTLLDDDPAPRVTLTGDGPTLSETDGVFTLTASLSSASSFDVVVALGFTGTATPEVDYIASSTRILIPSGSLSGTATLSALPDAIREEDESIVVNVVVVANARELGRQRVETTIVDDDEFPAVSLDLSPPAVLESGGTATLTATLSAVAGIDVTVDLHFTGTATRGTDYTFGAETLVIPAGSRTAATTITASQDALPEPNETVTVNILAVTNGVETSLQQVTTLILDDDLLPVVTLSSDRTTVPEENGELTVTAALSSIVGRDVTVDLEYGGTATNGVDYTAGAAQLVVPAGSQSSVTSLAALPDSLDELDETISVTIRDVVNATVGEPSQISAELIDDDPPPTVTLQLDTETIFETGGAATVTAALSQPSSHTVVVDLAYSGTATRLVDYAADASQIVIPAGDLQGTTVVHSVEDLIDEPGETVVVEIVNVLNAEESGVQQVQATILDDDLPPTVTLSVDRAVIPEAAGVAIVEAVLNAVTSRQVTVELVFSGLATEGVDYRPSSAEIVIPAGSLRGSVRLTALADSLNESDEPVVIDLANSTNAVEQGEQHELVTIVDDDAAPAVVLSVDNPALPETGTATLVAALTAVSGLNTTIELGFSGSATFDEDYVLSWTQIVIAAGQLTGTATITAAEDDLTEDSETVIAEIVEVANGVLVQPQRVAVAIADSETQLARIQGRKFHDRDGDGQPGEGEEFQDGWAIELLNADGQVVAIQRTHEVDLDESGSIDPASERGLYRFYLEPGVYAVREIGRDGWRQTAPIDTLAGIAFDLDQQLDLFGVGNFFENWSGEGEKWLQSAQNVNRWYYITTGGEFREWDNRSGPPVGTPLSGTLLATFDGSYHADPDRLIDVAPPEQRHTVIVAAGQQLADLDFGSLQLASIRGRNYFDANDNQLRDIDEEYLNDWTVELWDADGSLVAVQQTRDLDLDQDGEIDPDTERGWYLFDDLEPGDYSVRQVLEDGWRRTAPVDVLAQAAFVLDQEFDFFSSGNFWENYGGQGEKWLQSAATGGSWYYVTTTGGIWRWDRASGVELGIPLNGTLLATLSPKYHADPTLLIDAGPDIGTHRVTLVAGQFATDVDFGNLRLGPAPVLSRPTGPAGLGGYYVGSASVPSVEEGRASTIPEVVRGEAATTWPVSFLEPSRVDVVFRWQQQVDDWDSFDLSELDPLVEGTWPRLDFQPPRSSA